MAVTASLDALNHLISMEAHHSVHGVHAEHDPYKVLKECSISVICIVAGALICALCKKWTTPGLLIIFFGAQTGMNIYMKAVFATSEVLPQAPAEYCADLAEGEECGPWMGFQASFFVTGFQQFSGFIIFWIVYLPLKSLGVVTSEIKVLKSKQEVIAVLCFAASFTMNISLNNMSMALIPLTLNLIIRSCLPLSTFIAQWGLTKYTTGEGKPCKVLEVSLMVLGALMMCVSVWAKVQAEAEAEASKGGRRLEEAAMSESSKTLVGVVYCLVSLFSGSVNLALAGILKTSVKMDALNAVVYNSIPAAIILLPFVFFVKHPIKGWFGVSEGYDVWVVGEVWENSKSTFMVAASSGLASLIYNVLAFSIVQYLSATHVAFAGNFNKAATVPLALLVGLDTLPQGIYGPIMVGAAIMNIIAFALYNVVTGGAGGHGGGGGGSKEKEKEKLVAEKEPVSDSDESDSDDDSSEGGGCC